MPITKPDQEGAGEQQSNHGDPGNRSGAGYGAQGTAVHPAAEQTSLGPQGTTSGENRVPLGRQSCRPKMPEQTVSPAVHSSARQMPVGSWQRSSPPQLEMSSIGNDTPSSPQIAEATRVAQVGSPGKQVRHCPSWQISSVPQGSGAAHFNPEASQRLRTVQLAQRTLSGVQSGTRQWPSRHVVPASQTFGGPQVR